MLAIPFCDGCNCQREAFHTRRFSRESQTLTTPERRQFLQGSIFSIRQRTYCCICTTIEGWTSSLRRSNRLRGCADNSRTGFWTATSIPVENRRLHSEPPVGRVNECN